jgi:uncharacterized protein YdhG (YjbR/CyaY superfamily)
MANTDYQSVDQYIAAQPQAIRPVLERLRGILRKAMPQADEVISYQIPAYKLNGAIVLFFAGWKQHFSLYPARESILQAFAQELAGYKITKGTIRFPLAEPIPTRLIAGIARLRVQEVAAAQSAKAVKTKAKAKATAVKNTSTKGSSKGAAKPVVRSKQPALSSRCLERARAVTFGSQSHLNSRTGKLEQALWPWQSYFLCF